MRGVLLTFGALVMPLVWGWLVHWAIDRFWPARQDLAKGQGQDDAQARSNPLDYQI